VLVIAFGFPKTFIFEVLESFYWFQFFPLRLSFPVLSDTKLAQRTYSGTFKASSWTAARQYSAPNIRTEIYRVRLKVVREFVRIGRPYGYVTAEQTHPRERRTMRNPRAKHSKPVADLDDVQVETEGFGTIEARV
jgi:hypothetical protein